MEKLTELIAQEKAALEALNDIRQARAAEELRIQKEQETAIPHMITVPAAVKRYGLPQYLIYRLCDNGQIAHIKAGKRYLINETSLAQLLTTSGKM